MKKIRTNPEKITYRACKVTEWGYIRSVDNEGRKPERKQKNKG